MNEDKILVTSVGFLGIIFTYWFFLRRSEVETFVSESVNITVDGGYSPSAIVIKRGGKVRLNFWRKDPSPCLEEVVLPEFKIRTYLPLNKAISLEITPTTTGEFAFSCGMNMYHGKVIVSDA